MTRGGAGGGLLAGVPGLLSLGIDPSGRLHQDDWPGRLRHFAYAAGWKKFEPLWDWVIRARKVAHMLPVLEAVLGGEAHQLPSRIDPVFPPFSIRPARGGPFAAAGLPRGTKRAITGKEVRSCALEGRRSPLPTKVARTTGTLAGRGRPDGQEDGSRRDRGRTGHAPDCREGRGRSLPHTPGRAASRGPSEGPQGPRESRTLDEDGGQGRGRRRPGRGRRTDSVRGDEAKSRRLTRASGEG